MDNILISIISITIGVAATIYASRHYYRRSVDKELTPFVQLQSNVLSHIDKEVKSDLHIEYKGVKVENLQQLQFLVANTGERAIRDIIKPLRLDLPDDIEIMETNILHISPEGRQVSLNVLDSGCSVELSFPLLNKDEFFIFKLLVKGTPKRSELKFTVVADDLPPQLKIQGLSYNQIETDGKSIDNEFELGLLMVGLTILLSASFLGILAHYVQPESFPVIKSETFLWLNKVPFIFISSIVGYIIAVILALIGGMMSIAAIFGSFEFPKSKKFSVPKELASINYGFREFDETMAVVQEPANKPLERDAQKQ